MHTESHKAMTDPSTSNFLDIGICRLCHCYARPGLTVHHLIPWSTHTTNIASGRFTKLECASRTVKLCQPCHSVIHQLIPNEVLGEQYNTLERVSGHEAIVEYLASPTTHPLNRMEQPVIPTVDGSQLQLVVVLDSIFLMNPEERPTKFVEV